MEKSTTQQKRLSIINARNTIKIWMAINYRSDVSSDNEFEIFRGLKPIAWLASITGAFQRNILQHSPTNTSTGRKRKWTSQRIYCALLGIFYFVNFCLSTKDSISRIKSYPSTSGMRRVADLMHTVGPRLATFILYLYLGHNTGKIQMLIKHLVTLSKSIHNNIFWGNSKQDQPHSFGSSAARALVKYPTFCKVALICAMVNGFSENFAFDLHIFKLAYIKLAAFPLKFADYKQLLETQVTYENYPWNGGSWEPWLPTSQYKVENLERLLIWNPCGISLFGTSTFVIKRKFFVSIISFIFTTEIVLLQANNNHDELRGEFS